VLAPFDEEEATRRDRACDGAAGPTIIAEMETVPSLTVAERS
jgi:hypothetical protein